MLWFLSHEWAGLVIAAAVVAGGLWGARSLRPRQVQMTAGMFAGVGVLLAVGAGYHVLHLASIRREVPPPGMLVDVGGYRMHVLAEGESHGKATLLWMPGAHAAGHDFYHLHSAMRSETRSILIDRPGSGWSDPGPFPRTTAVESEEVVIALQRAGEKRPFVLIGHSFGGLLVANIARRHPQLVAALVLLDATPPDAINYAPPNPFLSAMRRDAALTILLRLFGIHHEMLMSSMEDTAAAGAADYSIFAELQPGGLGWDNTVYDGELGNVAVYLVAPVGIPGFDATAHVLYASGGHQPGSEVAFKERLRNFWDRSRERYRFVAAHVERVYAPAGSSHNFPFEHPEFVIDILRRVLTEHGSIAQ